MVTVDMTNSEEREERGAVGDSVEGNWLTDWS